MQHLFYLLILVGIFLDSYSTCLDKSVHAFISSRKGHPGLFLGGDTLHSSSTFRKFKRHVYHLYSAQPPPEASSHDVDDDGIEAIPSDAQQSLKKKQKVGETIKDNYSEVYKKILKSPSKFTGPSYSLREYGEELPEGSKTFFDFLPYPRNYDFFGSAKISSGIDDYFDPDGSKHAQNKKDVAERAQGGDRFHGPYPKSAYFTISGIKRVDRRKKSTLDPGEPEIDPEDMFDVIANKNVDQLGTIDSSRVEYDTKLGPPDNVPLEKINPNYFLFDTQGYIRHYLKYLNRYDYKTLSANHKDPTKLDYYLNNDYIERIEKPFPPPPQHTEKVREYFMGLIPSLMDELVVKIKNDPNKYNTPSPPMHSPLLLSKFKMPDYLMDGYDDKGDSKDYKKFASLEGLHDPSQSLTYPYSNLEPLRQRQLLSVYIDVLNTKDLGTPPSWTKRSSKTKALRRSIFPSATQLPLEHPLDGIEYSTASSEPGDPMNVQTGDLEDIQAGSEMHKLYVKGKKKRGLALVYLEPGTGHLIINERDGYQYLQYNKFWLNRVFEPLSTMYLHKRFNVIARTKGGGLSGQSVAIRHAIVRYIYTILVPKVKNFLRICKLVAPDVRRVERKKTNLRKARKKEKYSKR